MRMSDSDSEESDMMSDSDSDIDNIDNDEINLMQLGILTDMMMLEDNKDEEFFQFLILSGGLIMGLLKETWKCRVCRLATRRVDWKEHVNALSLRGDFGNTYLMEKQTFEDLVELLHDGITFNEIKARNAAPDAEPIFPELVLAMTCRLVGGGREQDIRDWAGVSESSFFRCRDQLFFSVLHCDDLAIKFPHDNPQKLDVLAHGFASKSNPGGDPVFPRCVGCINGTIIRITLPRGVKNKMAYFSGHYHCFGLNVQAICDSHCRFIYFAIAGAGSTPDIMAMQEVRLDELIESLLAGYYVIGDNAYPLSEQIIIPYSRDRTDPSKDAFNFYLSQLRIRIEMAFGVFTSKFRIFRKPLSVSLKMASEMLRVCAWLHNYIINKQRPPELEAIEELPVDEVSGMTEDERKWGYIPGEPPSDDDMDVDGEEVLPSLQNIWGLSHIQDEMLKCSTLLYTSTRSNECSLNW